MLFYTCMCVRRAVCLFLFPLCMKSPWDHRMYVWNDQSQRKCCLSIHLKKIHESHGTIDFQTKSQLFLAGCQSNWAFMRQHPHSVIHQLQRCQFCVHAVIVPDPSGLQRAQWTVDACWITLLTAPKGWLTACLNCIYRWSQRESEGLTVTAAAWLWRLSEQRHRHSHISNLTHMIWHGCRK